MDADDLRPLLASLKFFKAKYTHNASAAGFCFDALSYLALGHWKPFEISTSKFCLH